MNIKIKLAEHEKFETDRLILRKIELSDAQEMYEFTSDPEVVRFVTYAVHENLECTQDGIVTYFMSHRLETWGIVDKTTHKVIGTIDLRVKGDSGTFGWQLNRHYWGQKLMPEAAVALRDFAFNTLDLSVLTAKHFTENQKSGRVMQKIGMKKIGQLYVYVEKLEKSVLVDNWALTKEEYENEIKNK